MCTAITYKSKYHYFGRNLDVEKSYGEEIAITPRNYKFTFSDKLNCDNNYAIIGVACVVDDYPLYFDAVNEQGLAMAGLSFVGNAYYSPYSDDKDNVSPYELIPWILRNCKSISEAKAFLERINLYDKKFSENIPLSDLHWIVSDNTGSIVVEALKEGIKIHDNKLGVLTNNPEFPYHVHNLNNYFGLSAENYSLKFFDEINLNHYSRGMGAMGLPGDYSSMSRFVKASFIKYNSQPSNSETGNVTQFFHILNSVEMPDGSVKVEDGSCEITAYSNCYNADLGILYYRTYVNSRISCVKIHKENLDADKIIRYKMAVEQSFYLQN